MGALTLSSGQKKANQALTSFLLNPNERVFVLGGYSGTGKSTLVQHFFNNIGTLLEKGKMINPNLPDYEIVLTATTNKAAENLERITKQEVKTIHSHIGARVVPNYMRGPSDPKLKLAHNLEDLSNQFIVIDEASFIDSLLLKLILKRTRDCKVLFIGDPAQLLSVDEDKPIVFNKGYNSAELTEVLRHDGPILELATMFRNVVTGSDFFKFKPDGKAIQHLPRAAFGKAVLDEMSRPDWKYTDSKILTWTNRKAITFNKEILEHVKGTQNFQVGDYAICNSFIQCGNHSIKTDQIVRITWISDKTEFELDVAGRWIEVDGRARLFLPTDPTAIKRKAQSLNKSIVKQVETSWIDLRAAYAHTVNKSQGSTYETAFIDLDDIALCKDTDQLARLLYVAVSRASKRVILTGDLA